MFVYTTNYAADAPPRPSWLHRVSSTFLIILSAVGVYYLGSTLQRRVKDKARRGRMKKFSESSDTSSESAVEDGKHYNMRYLHEQIEGIPHQTIEVGHAAANAALNAVIQQSNKLQQINHSNCSNPPIAQSSHPDPSNCPLPSSSSSDSTCPPSFHPPTPALLHARDTRVFFDFLNLYAQVDDQETIANNLAIQLTQAAATAQTLAAARAYSASVPNSPTKFHSRDSLGRPMGELERLQAAEIYSKFAKRKRAKELAQSLRIQTRELSNEPAKFYSLNQISFSQPVSPVSSHTPVQTSFQPHPASIQPILLTPAQTNSQFSRSAIHPSSNTSNSQFTRSLPYQPVHPHQTLPQSNALTSSFSSSQSRPPLSTLSSSTLNASQSSRLIDNTHKSSNSTSQVSSSVNGQSSSIVHSLMKHRRDRSLPATLLKGIAKKSNEPTNEGLENEAPLNIHQL